MNLLLAIIAITGLSLVISLVSDVRQGLGITHISVALLLSVALLVGISIMAGPLKSQGAVPMARGTPVVFSMVLPGELLKHSDIKNSLLTRSIPNLVLVLRVLAGSALENAVAALGVGRSGHEWTRIPCRKSCFGKRFTDHNEHGG